MRVGLVGAGLVASLLVGSVFSPEPARAATNGPFRGLGAWVDVYDYAPAFIDNGAPPTVTPASVADMAALGVRTLYLQAAQDDTRSKGKVVDRELLARFLAAGREHDVRMVAWYLPKFEDLDADLRRIRALSEFSSDGDEFDGLALDIEWTGSVPDGALRNERLVELSHRARDLVGGMPLGAIVLEPVLLEVVSPDYWPAFPWRKIRDDYDAWMPMTYWTNRNEKSGHREGFRYTDENIRRLRANLGRDDVAVHPVGGIADAASTADVAGFVRAARSQDAIGWSVYDYATTTSGLWPRLRGGR
ncbi:MAG: hypothetical protein ACXW2Y_10290 [Acidimicrobiia bacterium]